MSSDGEFTRTQIFGTVFEITNRYTDLNPVGMGAFGLVCSAVDKLTGQNVAVKKIMKPFSTSVLAKRTYRELKLLKHLRHENLITLDDIFISPLEDIYFVNELQGTDLHRLLTSRPLEKQFIQYFTYQILRGMKYIHSAGVIHRDLKPSNILINENCDLKICDFGLARIQDPQMTGYVSTRYYRAPEIMLTWQKYDTEVDIWSVGCILSEMIEGKPLFPGKDHVHQFSIITELLGSPPADVIDTICSENTLRFVQSLPHRDPIPFSERFASCTHVEPEAIDLLSKMLVFDPKKRISAAEALTHPYMEPYHDPTDEPVCETKFDWSFNDADLPVDNWRVMMYREILDFHQSIGVGGSGLDYQQQQVADADGNTDKLEELNRQQQQQQQRQQQQQQRQRQRLPLRNEINGYTIDQQGYSDGVSDSKDNDGRFMTVSRRQWEMVLSKLSRLEKENELLLIKMLKLESDKKHLDKEIEQLVDPLQVCGNGLEIDNQLRRSSLRQLSENPNDDVKLQTSDTVIPKNVRDSPLLCQHKYHNDSRADQSLIDADMRETEDEKQNQEQPSGSSSHDNKVDVALPNKDEIAADFNQLPSSLNRSLSNQRHPPATTNETSATNSTQASNCANSSTNTTLTSQTNFFPKFDITKFTFPLNGPKPRQYDLERVDQLSHDDLVYCVKNTIAMFTIPLDENFAVSLLRQSYFIGIVARFVKIVHKMIFPKRADLSCSKWFEGKMLKSNGKIDDKMIGLQYILKEMLESLYPLLRENAHQCRDKANRASAEKNLNMC